MAEKLRSQRECYERTSPVGPITVTLQWRHNDHDKKNPQSSASLAFVWEIHRGRWFSRTKGQLRGKCFHLMTSSWCARLSNVIAILCGLHWLWCWFRRHSIHSVYPISSFSQFITITVAMEFVMRVYCKYWAICHLFCLHNNLVLSLVLNQCWNNIKISDLWIDVKHLYTVNLLALGKSVYIILINMEGIPMGYHHHVLFYPLSLQLRLQCNLQVDSNERAN